MNPRIIVCPVEGALLSPSGALPEDTRAALDRARERRTTLILTSPRPVPTVRGILATTGLDTRGVVLVGSRGASVVEADTGLILARTHLPLDIAAAVVASTRERPGSLPLWYAEGRLLTERPDHPWALASAAADGLEVVGVEDLADQPVGPDLVAVLDDAELSRPAAQRLRAAAEGASLWLPSPLRAEVTAAAATPAEAVRRYCAYVGAAPASVVAFGVTDEDLAVFAEAGVSIALGEAPESVQAAADAVTRRVEDGGLATALDDQIPQ